MRSSRGVGDKDQAGPRLRYAPGELPQAFAHEARLKADVRGAHLAIEFGLGDERGDRIDHDDIHRVAAHEEFSDLKRLLPAVGLGDQQVFELDAERLRVSGIEGVFGIDDAAVPPDCCALAMVWRHRVVLPDDSGPKTSMMRPLGKPPTRWPDPGPTTRSESSGQLRAATRQYA